MKIISRGPLLAPKLLAVVVFCYVSSGVYSAPAVSHASPTPTPPPTAGQVRAAQAVLAFYSAYDRRDVATILGLLDDPFRYVDCDYAHHRMATLESRAAVRRWLQARFRENDRFVVLGPLIVDRSMEQQGVGGPLSRHSDSVDPLAARGLIPSDNYAFKIVVRGGRLHLVSLAGYDFCAAGIRPRGSKPKQERRLAHAFLAAYDRHDIDAVLRTISPDVVYEDYDYTSAQFVWLKGRDAVERWLRARFADGDRLRGATILLDSYLSQPQSDPRTIMVRAARSSMSIAAIDTSSKPVVVRIVPDADVRHIRIWQAS